MVNTMPFIEVLSTKRRIIKPNFTIYQAGIRTQVSCKIVKHVSTVFPNFTFLTLQFLFENYIFCFNN